MVDGEWTLADDNGWQWTSIDVHMHTWTIFDVVVPKEKVKTVKVCKDDLKRSISEKYLTIELPTAAGALQAGKQVLRMNSCCVVVSRISPSLCNMSSARGRKSTGAM